MLSTLYSATMQVAGQVLAEAFQWHTTTSVLGELEKCIVAFKVQNKSEIPHCLHEDTVGPQVVVVVCQLNPETPEVRNQVTKVVVFLSQSVTLDTDLEDLLVIEHGRCRHLVTVL